MNCEILAVGTELLLGNIVNTNACFLSNELAKLGINVYYQTVVGDNAARLSAALTAAFARADLVIATGGLGPTEDDLTKEVAADYFQLPLILDERSLTSIETYFQKQNLCMTSNNKKQALIPEGAHVLENHWGTAPGIMVEKDGKILILLPGPPNETEPMFTTHCVPFLKERTDGLFFSREIHICGVGESAVEDRLKDMIDGQRNPTIAPYAKTGRVTLRITASGADEDECRTLLQPVVDEIYRRLGSDVYGEDAETLESVAVNALQEKGLTLAVAESCTGGLLTAALVNVPGASQTLQEGMVTYSNEAKMRRLGVSGQTLAAHGAVSEETALEMAKGAAQSAGADVGIATTGVAGPGGGTSEKPVGLVYIAVYCGGNTKTVRLNLRGSREQIRTRAVIRALDLLRRTVQEN